MNDPSRSVDRIIDQLKERAKELNCLYAVQEFLSRPELPFTEIAANIITLLPQAWQYPDVCHAELVYLDQVYRSTGYKETAWVQSADIIVQNEKLGKISVCYSVELPSADEGPFLKEERKLLDTITEQVGWHLLHEQLKEVFREKKKTGSVQKNEWVVIIDMLKHTDPDLLLRITRKMINYLTWQGIKEGEELLDRFAPISQKGIEQDLNQPFEQRASVSILTLCSDAFQVASRHLSRENILENIQKWIKEERSSFLIDTLLNTNTSLADVSAALERYRMLAKQGIELTGARQEWFSAALVRTLLSEQIKFINIAKQHVTIDDFSEFMHRVIFPTNSRGKLGGKGAGLFLASHILDKKAALDELLQNIKTPKTRYLTSDTVLYFMSYNNMEDIVEQKYKDVSQVRQEYPYIIHMFKSAAMPPEIVKGLALALEDFGDVPLIVRSSSLLEDQVDAVFAGKYKSLFIPNTGTRKERLAALVDAITEVFASLFGPDPIQYRIEHGLMDFHEEMGVMIQEVVGRRIGSYFMPAFAGVAFSNNEFRWSSRIKREDGLIRLVPGLGTRAVDRIGDDYPLLIAPGQPGLRVNVTTDEVVYYSPKKADVINLDSQKFETVEVSEIIKSHGREFPLLHQIVSILEPDYVRVPSSAKLDHEQGHFVVTFEGLFTRTPFLKQMRRILDTLQEAFGCPIDIEFAHDGTAFYLLQCRAQSFNKDTTASEIPRDIPAEQILFSANRYISNGRVPELKYVVYVDPSRYSELTEYKDMLAVGKAVGRLNQILPKRQFVLMGPGRWGSRGDIKLGVSVTYSEINNTAMLIEIARKKKDYLPELSFGTHFFQDLVEAAIRYLPLYPDEQGMIFNEEFLLKQNNVLADLLPDCAPLSNVIRVIDVPASTNGQILRVAMNADEEKALGYLADPSEKMETVQPEVSPALQADSDFHWRWRLQSAETISAHLDAQRFGVKAFYIFGSTKNATAGPGSDIDILIHFQGNEDQRKELLTWLEGWSLSLGQINYLRTGVQSAGLLDVHLVTDADIKKGTSYAAKIGAVTDAARPLFIGTELKPKRTD